MKLVFATIDLVLALASVLALGGCEPFSHGPSLVVTETAHVTVEPAAPPVQPEPTEAPPQRSEGCGCGENCPCREAGGDCRCGDPPIPDKTLEAIEAYHKEVESHESDSVSDNAGSVESVSGKAPLVIHAWAGNTCPPCNRFKSEVLPVLQAAGWVEGKHYQIIEHAPYSVTAPAFEWQGKPFHPGGYGDKDSWLRSLKAVMGQIPATSAQVEAKSPSTSSVRYRKKTQGLSRSGNENAGVSRSTGSARSPAFNGMAAKVDPAAPGWAVRICIRSDRSDAVGSGVIISGNGRYTVLTNAHVTEAPGTVLVAAGGQWRSAQRGKADRNADLGLLTFSGPEGLPVLPVADAVADGAGVASHGFAAGVVYREQATTLHHRTERGGFTPHAYFTAAKFCPGESGGPVEQDGRLVGLISASERTENPDGGSGHVVALPSIRAFLNLPARDVASPGPVPPSRASNTGRGGVPHLSKTPMVGLAEATPRPAFSR